MGASNFFGNVDVWTTNTSLRNVHRLRSHDIRPHIAHRPQIAPTGGHDQKKLSSAVPADTNAPRMNESVRRIVTRRDRRVSPKKRAPNTGASQNIVVVLLLSSHYKPSRSLQEVCSRQAAGRHNDTPVYINGEEHPTIRTGATYPWKSQQ